MPLITGPSGHVGVELVEMLSDVGDLSWRIASRHPTPSQPAAAQWAGFDFFDRASWASALTGVTSLFLLFPLPGTRAAREAIVPFVHAAEQAGCGHVVYVSVFGADRVPIIPHHRVEAALRASTMCTTILRCSFFMQNLHRVVSTHGVDIADRGELFIPAGDGRTTFLDARDSAAVAALALLHPEQHRNVVHHLTGPAALTMDEVAAALSGALHHPVQYTHPSLARLRPPTPWEGSRLGQHRIHGRGVHADPVRPQPTHHRRRSPPARPAAGTLTEFLHDSAWRWHDRAWT